MPPSAAATATGFRGAWAHRQWRVLLSAYAVSMMGDWLYGVALLAWLLDRTGSPGWLAAAELARILPSALLGSLAGVVADRWDRRRLLVALDLTRATLMLAMAVLIAVDGMPAVAIVLVAVSGLIGTPYGPAISAATPQVVDENSLAAANATGAMVAQVTWSLGPVLGAVVLAVSSAEWAFVLNAATFLASALLLTRLRLPATGPAGRPRKAVDRPTFLGQLQEGLATVRSVPDLVIVTGLIAASFFTFGFEQVLHVLVAEDRLGLGADGLGWLTGAIGVGGLLASPFTMRIARTARTGEALVVASVLLGAPLALLAVVTDPRIAVALLLLEGFGAIVFEVLTVTLLQRLSPRHTLGRVFGLQDSASSTANLTGALLAPILVAAFSLEAALVAGGGFLLVYAGMALAPLTRAGRHARLTGHRLEPTVVALAQLPMLEGAAPEVLEGIAAAVVPEHRPAGATLMTEGEPADDLFVVRHGRLGVLVRGTRINEVGPGDVVGEMGVIARRPRNATVVADTDIELWRVSGAAFLAAMELHPVMPDALRRGITARLASHPPMDAAP